MNRLRGPRQNSCHFCPGRFQSCRDQERGCLSRSRGCPSAPALARLCGRSLLTLSYLDHIAPESGGRTRLPAVGFQMVPRTLRSGGRAGDRRASRGSARQVGRRRCKDLERRVGRPAAASRLFPSVVVRRASVSPLCFPHHALGASQGEAPADDGGENIPSDSPDGRCRSEQNRAQPAFRRSLAYGDQLARGLLSARSGARCDIPTASCSHEDVGASP